VGSGECLIDPEEALWLNRGRVTSGVTVPVTSGATSEGSTSWPRSSGTLRTVATIPVDFTLHVRDNADTDVDVRWCDEDGEPYPLTSGSAQIRATEASATVLVTATVTLLGAPDYYARVTFAKADIAAANFEALDMDDPPYWDVVLVRTSDSKALVPVSGRVQWRKGVTR
jgi:hypothetical protein